MSYTFKVGGDDRVFLLTYGRETQVWDLGPGVLGMTAFEAAEELDHGVADRDCTTWGRLVMQGRQGGYAPLVGQYSVEEVREWLRTLSHQEFEALVSEGGLVL